MTIVTEYDWESDTWTHHTGENAARAAWREAIEIAEKAKATLRQSATAASCVAIADTVFLVKPGWKSEESSIGHPPYLMLKG
jgi:hypothetical protein